MPSHTSRDDPAEREANLRRVLGTPPLPAKYNLKPDQIPTNLHRNDYDPFGYDDDPHEEARLKAIKALPKGGTPQEGNARMLALLEQYPYPEEKPSAEQLMQEEYTYPIDPNKGRWSDDPMFRHVEMVDAPRLHPSGEITFGPKLQFNLDPEKHIERTSNAPGAEGSGSSERPYEQHVEGKPPKPYGGSVDARNPDLDPYGAHLSTASVWDEKKQDVQHPAGAEQPVRDQSGKHLRSAKTGKPAYKRVHAAGLFDALMSGEDVRSPVHLIRDPDEPIYGPRKVQPYQTSPGGRLTDIDPGDAGGFGHDEPVQWQGHHRVAAAALKQQVQRESGMQSGWSVPVPFKLHEGKEEAVSNMVWGTGNSMTGERAVSETLMEGLHQSGSRVAHFTRGGALSGTAGAAAHVPKPKRVLGSRMAPGTWNPKAY